MLLSPPGWLEEERKFKIDLDVLEQYTMIPYYPHAFHSDSMFSEVLGRGIRKTHPKTNSPELKLVNLPKFLDNSSKKLGELTNPFGWVGHNLGELVGFWVSWFLGELSIGRSSEGQNPWRSYASKVRIPRPRFRLLVQKPPYFKTISEIKWMLLI